MERPARGTVTLVSNDLAARLLASIVSAGLGFVALLTCVAVLVLTDDDLDVGPTGMPGSPVGEAPSGSGSADSGAGARPDAAPGAPPDLSSCTDTVCPGTGVPTTAAGDFPYPPGTTAPEWTQDWCSDIYEPEGTTIRQVRGTLDEVRNFYLTRLATSGYGWGPDQVRANPFTTGDDGSQVVLGWDAALVTSSSASAGGRLSIERSHEQQTSCGPPLGAVFIKVRQS